MSLLASLKRAPVYLGEIVGRYVMACCFTARVAVGSDPDVIDVFRLVCQRRFRSEDNSGQMDSWML